MRKHQPREGKYLIRGRGGVGGPGCWESQQWTWTAWWPLAPRRCRSRRFSFLLLRGWWGLGLLSRVECEMLQRRAIVLQCFVLLYKKEEINTHFLLHALGSIPPPRPPLDPAGEAPLCSKTDSPAFRGRNANSSFCT